MAGQSLSVRVVNTYRPILDRFQAAWGGAVAVHRRGDSNTRLCWEWRAYGDNAEAFLADILPLLREKAPQAYLGLHFRSLPPGHQGRAHTRDALSLLKKTTHFQ